MTNRCDKFVGHVFHTELAGQLRIVSVAPGGDKGGEGCIYATRNATGNMEYYVKLWAHQDMDIFIDRGEYEKKKRVTQKRYQLFASLGFGRHQELWSLPLEYVEIAERPAYIMRRAKGIEMDSGWSELAKLPLNSRTKIACALATTVRMLHCLKVVHADICRTNFFFDKSDNSVQVLDVDAGGYWGLPRLASWESTGQRFVRQYSSRGFAFHSFPPITVGKGIYVAPELRRNPRNPWSTLWDEDQGARRVQPDLWALAVMIYEIVIDSNGPFPNNEYFGGDAAYKPYPKWPSLEQNQRLEDLRIDSKIKEMFIEVFGAMNRTRSDCSRPTAERWETALLEAINAAAEQWQTEPLEAVNITSYEEATLAPETVDQDSITRTLGPREYTGTTIYDFYTIGAGFLEMLFFAGLLIFTPLGFGICIIILSIATLCSSGWAARIVYIQNGIDNRSASSTEHAKDILQCFRWSVTYTLLGGLIGLVLVIILGTIISVCSFLFKIVFP
jgi:hypothetical protein